MNNSAIRCKFPLKQPGFYFRSNKSILVSYLLLLITQDNA